MFKTLFKLIKAIRRLLGYFSNLVSEFHCELINQTLVRVQLGFHVHHVTFPTSRIH
jgi:hypothetical protein